MVLNFTLELYLEVKNYTSLVGPVNYEAQVRQHDRGGVLYSLLLSVLVSAMLSAGGGDRPRKQLLRNFMPYLGV